VRTVGYDRADNLRIAKELQRIAAIPGVVDAHLQQEQYAPDFLVDIDRARALQFGITASDIGNNISTTFSSFEQVQSNFWTDPKNGIPYYFAVQTPQYLVSSMGDIGNTGTAQPTIQPVPGELQNVATFARDSVPGSANEANIQPVYEVFASTQGRDLGSIASSIDKIRTDLKKELKPGNTIQVAGQIDSMNQAFRDMGIGLVFAAVFVYLLMVVNYQTWGDPFVVILALPATFCGIVTVLYITDTTLSVPSLMGAIMAVGGRLGKLDPARHLCARAAARRHDGFRRRDRGRACPHSASLDDRHCDDRRHDPDGDRRAGRGAERRPRTRGDRRPLVRNPDHAPRAAPVCDAAQGQ
jgi:multidrug efflux pump subunit AcrB